MQFFANTINDIDHVNRTGRFELLKHITDAVVKVEQPAHKGGNALFLGTVQCLWTVSTRLCASLRSRQQVIEKGPT